jgi:23S rRNA (cytidine1920-2'-O)/16S rRNA (cytidine1409-2'-O)-methyltransferase
MTQRRGANYERVDLLLIEQGLAASRSNAQALILAGRVFLGEARIEKPGTTIERGRVLTVREGDRFVSRGGIKLDAALDDLSLSVEGKICVDIGASTGGFSDCLLQRGAAKVYAVDVGQGQLAEKLRRDPRIVVMERTNARYLETSDFADAIGLVTVDASFIGIGKLITAIARILPAHTLLLAMLKPQFEAGRELARKYRGVIRDEAVRLSALTSARAQIEIAGFELIAECDSRLRGPKGNLERFVLAKRTTVAAPIDPDQG